MKYDRDYMHSLEEYDNHHLVTFLHDDTTGMEAYVAIHRMNGSTPSFGATRLWKYASDTDALRDALRLSRGMSYKAALAGLPCGGAKGVIIDNGGSHKRILEVYAANIAMLKNGFVTGTDVGVRQQDLVFMKKRAPNIIGFNDNSTEFTSIGIYHAIRCALRATFSDDSVKDRTFSIQGVGKIGSAMVELLAPEAKSISISDIDSGALKRAVKRHPNITVVPPERIHRQKVDVFCPCAMGNAINTGNVAELNCAIVAGGANNQLENEQVGDILHKMNILYAPDFVVNAGGLIAVYDEYEHTAYDKSRVRNKVAMITKRLQDIIEESRSERVATHRIANAKAERIFNSYAS